MLCLISHLAFLSSCVWFHSVLRLFNAACLSTDRKPKCLIRCTTVPHLRCDKSIMLHLFLANLGDYKRTATAQTASYKVKPLHDTSRIVVRWKKTSNVIVNLTINKIFSTCRWSRQFCDHTASGNDEVSCGLENADHTVHTTDSSVLGLYSQILYWNNSVQKPVYMIQVCNV